MKIFASSSLVVCIALCSLAEQSLAQIKKETFVQQAEQKMRMGDVGKAELLYMHALQQSPTDANIASAVAEFYIQQHRVAEAEKLINAADQSNPHVWRARSLLFQAQGDDAKSITALEKAFALGGDTDIFTLTRLQQHYEATGNTARQKQMENLQQAVEVKTKSAKNK
jgi:tetratricopeptide (TPR) repeat protein